MAEHTCYLNRSDVRSLLIAQPDENLDITEAILYDIDQLQIHTAEDIRGYAPAAPDWSKYNVSVDVSTGDDITASDRIYGAVIDAQPEADGKITLLCEYTSDNFAMRAASPTLSEQFERVIKALNYQGGVNGDENSLTVGEIRRALP